MIHWSGEQILFDDENIQKPIGKGDRMLFWRTEWCINSFKLSREAQGIFFIFGSKATLAKY